MIMIFFFIPTIFIFFVLSYCYDLFLFDFGIGKESSFLIEKFIINLDKFIIFFAFFWEFLLKLLLFLNFSILFLLFLNFIINLSLVLLKFLFFDIFCLFFKIQSFPGIFFFDYLYISNNFSLALIPHFFSDLTFFILFLYFVLFNYGGLYADRTHAELDKELNMGPYEKFIDVMIENDKDYHDIGNSEIIFEISDSKKNNSKYNETFLYLWHLFEQEPYNIFNFENIDMQAAGDINLISSMVEHTYRRSINTGNQQALHFNLVDGLKNNLFNFFKKFFWLALNFNFLKFNDSWKVFIDSFFFFIYLPCLIFVLLKMLLIFCFNIFLLSIKFLLRRIK